MMMPAFRVVSFRRLITALALALFAVIQHAGQHWPSAARVNAGAAQPVKYITNSIGMKLAPIAAGKFVMGSPSSEPQREEHEGPQHEVEISRPFYMGAHEVTVGQFRKFVDATGYKTDAEKNGSAYALFPDGTASHAHWKRD